MRALGVGPLAASGKTSSGDWKESRGVLGLLSDERAGRICTRNAGAISFEATFNWRSHDGITAGFVLNEPAPGARFYFLAQVEDDVAAKLRISCEVRAFYTEQLTGALDALLRYVTTHAALSDAVLEIRTVRLAAPTVTAVKIVEALAWQLWDAGFPVSFGPSWMPAPDADVSVGSWGLEEAFEAFFRMHPAWKLSPPR
ncbi:MAG: hypothetical protein JOZ19_02375 [Rubrobacter sp.]|nr:hypothetical protein [Rubrobacter sp.]